MSFNVVKKYNNKNNVVLYVTCSRKKECEFATLNYILSGL